MADAPPMPKPLIDVKDERVITIPNVALNVQGTRQITDFLNTCAEDGYTLKGVGATRRDYGNQRDPDVRTTAVILTFTRP